MQVAAGRGLARPAATFVAAKAPRVKPACLAPMYRPRPTSSTCLRWPPACTAHSQPQQQGEAASGGEEQGQQPATATEAAGREPEAQQHAPSAAAAPRAAAQDQDVTLPAGWEAHLDELIAKWVEYARRGSGYSHMGERLGALERQVLEMARELRTGNASLTGGVLSLMEGKPSTTAVHTGLAEEEEEGSLISMGGDGGSSKEQADGHAAAESSGSGTPTPTAAPTAAPASPSRSSPSPPPQQHHPEPPSSPIAAVAEVLRSSVEAVGQAAPGHAAVPVHGVVRSAGTFISPEQVAEGRAKAAALAESRQEGEKGKSPSPNPLQALVDAAKLAVGAVAAHGRNSSSPEPSGTKPGPAGAHAAASATAQPAAAAPPKAEAHEQQTQQHQQVASPLAAVVQAELKQRAAERVAAGVEGAGREGGAAGQQAAASGGSTSGAESSESDTEQVVESHKPQPHHNRHHGKDGEGHHEGGGDGHKEKERSKKHDFEPKKPLISRQSLYDFNRLQSSLTELANSGYIESVKNLRETLLIQEWDMSQRHLAKRRAVAMFERYVAERDLVAEVGGYPVLSALYEDPDALEELLPNDRMRMLARSMMEECLNERRLALYQVANQTAKEMASLTTGSLGGSVLLPLRQGFIGFLLRSWTAARKWLPFLP